MWRETMLKLYEILGLSKDASPDEIKKAYRTLVKEHHPDRGGNEENFREIQEAYDTLSDPEAREAYDTTGEVAKPLDITTEATELIKEECHRALNAGHFEADTSNLVGMIKAQINEYERLNKESINDYKLDIRIYEEAKKRLKSEILLPVVEGLITSSEKKIKDLEKNNPIYDLAHKLLDQCEYKYDRDVYGERIRDKYYEIDDSEGEEQIDFFDTEPRVNKGVR